VAHIFYPVSGVRALFFPDVARRHIWEKKGSDPGNRVENMRHRNSGRRLGRNSSHRKAMYRNMAASMLKHETIRTTLPKAKELRRVVEPLITLAKEDSVANRRLAFDRLRDKEVVGKLFTDLGPRFKARPGGYLRILKTGPRPGDAAPMAIIMLTEQAVAVEAVAE